MDFFENDIKKKIEEEKIQRESHSLWCERYRPITIDAFIGNDGIKEKVNQYIRENDIPHLLLYGRAGVGKTSLSLMLVKSINCDYMYINASSENSVDNVRTKITNFASSAGFKDLKVIILDEADFFSPNAQAALRSVMETFSQHTRFILTCNYIERIIEPIVSRCQVFELIPPSKKDVAVHVNAILRKENVEASASDIAFIINLYYPDIRRTINTLQLQTTNNKLSVNQKDLIDSDYKLKIIDILKDSKFEKRDAFKEIRQLISNSSVSNFDDAYRLLYDTIDDYAKGHIAAVILIIAENEYKSAFVVDKEINFMACIIQMLNEIKVK